jgi:hypothetical protein
LSADWLKDFEIMRVLAESLIALSVSEIFESYYLYK